jgi:integrase
MITIRAIRELQPGQTLWDEGKGAVPGFLARRQRSAAISYGLFYRTAEGRQRWFTIGRHGAPWTPDAARDEAKRLLGEVAAGRDPAAAKAERRAGVTVAELAELYISDAEAGRLLLRGGQAKRSTTLATDRTRIAAHIKPVLGAMKVAAVTREDVEAFLHAVADGKTAGGRALGGRGTATRTTGLLGAIFSFAVKKGMRADNPVRGVTRFADGRRERRLTAEEYAMLGAGLQKAEGEVWPPAVAAARFLCLTGWRRGEVVGLEWSNVDLERRTVVLPTSKSGRSVRPLPQCAIDLLRTLPRHSTLVFPASRNGCAMTGFNAFWNQIVAYGGLPKEITPHIARHSFASVAGDLGYSELTIAALLGHRGVSMASRYVHLDAVLLEAADRVAGRILEMMQQSQSHQ